MSQWIPFLNLGSRMRGQGEQTLSEEDSDSQVSYVVKIKGDFCKSLRC